VIVSFKLYDVDRDGFITRKELTLVLTQMLSSMFPGEDPSFRVNDVVRRLFDDLDVNEDGHLVSFTWYRCLINKSLEEFKLSGLKEPLITDFLDQFLERALADPDGAASTSYKTTGEMGTILIPEELVEERSRRSSMSLLSMDGSYSQLSFTPQARSRSQSAIQRELEKRASRPVSPRPVSPRPTSPLSVSRVASAASGDMSV